MSRLAGFRRSIRPSILRERSHILSLRTEVKLAKTQWVPDNETTDGFYDASRTATEVRHREQEWAENAAQKSTCARRLEPMLDQMIKAMQLFGTAVLVSDENGTRIIDPRDVMKLTDAYP